MLVTERASIQYFVDLRTKSSIHLPISTLCLLASLQMVSPSQRAPAQNVTVRISFFSYQRVNQIARVAVSPSHTISDWPIPYSSLAPIGKKCFSHSDNAASFNLSYVPLMVFVLEA
jgi:hypothetical protein